MEQVQEVPQGGLSIRTALGMRPLSLETAFVLHEHLPDTGKGVSFPTPKSIPVSGLHMPTPATTVHMLHPPR